MVTNRYDALINIAKNKLKIYGIYKPYFSYFDSLTDEDLNNIKIVLDNLHFEVEETIGVESSFNEILTGAKESFDWFSSDVFEIFNILLPRITFSIDQEAGPSEFEALTDASLRFDNTLNRYTSQIVIPQRIEECSKYFLSHEFIHVVKDINYDEMRLLFTSIETVPILWEFINSYLDGDYSVMARVFSERYNQMLNIEMIYNDSNIFLDKYSKKNIKCSDKLAEAIQLLNMEACMYLNSFYYAICLFERFLGNEKLVLEYINKVLSGVITTKQLISKFDLFDGINNNLTYAKGYKNFKLIANNNFKK